MRALWNQETALHPTFASINRCLAEDWFLLPYELKLQAAHARALQAAGTFTSAEYAAVCGALERVAQMYLGGPCPDADAPESCAEDLHTWMEGRLTDLIGDPGRKIHTARSRNDQVATLLKMYVIDAGESLCTRLHALIETACRRARDWSELIFPLQTHTQFAAPGSVGFWALRYATAWDRARRHLAWCVSQWHRYCPLGSGAVAGSSIPIDRRIQAAELGFDAPSMNALDSTSNRDECLELLALAAQIALHLQSFAADVIAFSQTPFGWTVYPVEFATGSSMMPNKGNPDAMELLRGECTAVTAAHAHAVALLKGLPSGYNRDLQCLKPLVRDAVVKLGATCVMTNEFLTRLEFNAERLAASLTQGNVGATLRMEKKVKEGLPLREAHHAVAEDIRSSAGAGDSPNRMDAAAYATIGSASPSETRRVAEQLLAELSPTLI